jgi:hypothetical protein
VDCLRIEFNPRLTWLSIGKSSFHLNPELVNSLWHHNITKVEFVFKNGAQKIYRFNWSTTKSNVNPAFCIFRALKLPWNCRKLPHFPHQLTILLQTYIYNVLSYYVDLHILFLLSVYVSLLVPTATPSLLHFTTYLIL